jgi:N-acetylmuramoyl-L-alanine amidase
MSNTTAKGEFEPATLESVGGNSDTRLRFLLLLFMWFIALLPVFLAFSPANAATQISSARVWPAADYTRLTLESNQPIRFTYLMVKDPERLVVDLEDTVSGTELNTLASKITSDDPYIKSVRVGRFKPGVTRLVLDLKTAVNPSLFTLKPVGEYGHRLVLDVYPLQPVDPLLALVQMPSAKSAAAGGLVAEHKMTEKSDDEGKAKIEAVSLKPAEEVSKDVPQQTSKSAEEKLAKLAPRSKKNDEVTRLVTVAIDAGHGGEDPGAHGKGGANEKDVTLAIARKLKAQIDQQPNMRAVLTRDGDFFIPLQNRVVKARKVNADLFVSIHADAFIKSDARGSSVFALSEHGATSAAARWLAKKENDADLIGGVNIDVKDVYLKQTLIDLSQTATINDSLKLGKSVLSELGEINDLHKGAVEQAGFAVLKAPDIPSILVETAFISNPEEEKKLTDGDYQDKMAAAIVTGIRGYFAKNPPLARSKLARNL